MPLLRDVSTGFRAIRNLARSRLSRREVERRSAEFRPVARQSMDVAVYFADTRVNLYQIRQWYAPLLELSRTRPVVVICRSPRTALTVNEESGLPTVYLRTVVELEDFVASQHLRMVLYVNQNAKNFQMFRYGRMWHVFINHGESDKMYMTTNQFKAYDFAFVAGPAARDRLTRKLWSYDVEHRTLEIGRPQADHFAGTTPYPHDGRSVVLYSPTWEGDRPSALYGSVATHGEALAAAVLASPRHRLVYRPHPRSGVVHRAYGEANRRIVAAIEAANRADPSAHHVYDDGPELGWQLADAAVAICDISAMVYDRLATGKPLLVTRPVAPEAEVDEGGYLGAAEWLTASDAGDVLAIGDRVSSDPNALASLHRWARHHFGDTAPGAATQRFHAAVEELSRRWEEQVATHPFEGAERGDDDEEADPDSVPDEG